MKLNLLLTLILLLSVTGKASAEVIIDAWARATPPGGGSGAIYGKFENTGDETVELRSVSMENAGHVMIHETYMDDGMMRMRHSDIRLAPGESAVLEPGGIHIMLMGLKAPLISGCTYTFAAEWDNGERREHRFVVGGLGQMTRPDDAELQADNETCPQN